MKKIHLLILILVLILLIGIIGYRLWVLNYIENASDLLSSVDIKQPDTNLKHHYIFNNSGIDTTNKRVINLATGKSDLIINEGKGGITVSDSSDIGEKVLYLDGSQQQYLNIDKNDAPAIDISSGLSFVSYFKPISNNRLFDFGNGPSNNNIGVSNKSAFVFKGNQESSANQGGQYNKTPYGEWIFYVWTLTPDKKDPTKAKWIFYKHNDQPIETDGFYPIKLLQDKNYIGRNNSDENDYSTMFIKEFRIYNKVLTPEEVKTLKENLKLNYSIGDPAAEAKEKAEKLAQAELQKKIDEAEKAAKEAKEAKNQAFLEQQKYQEAQAELQKLKEKAEQEIMEKQKLIDQEKDAVKKEQLQKQLELEAEAARNKLAQAENEAKQKKAQAELEAQRKADLAVLAAKEKAAKEKAAQEYKPCETSCPTLIQGSYVNAPIVENGYFSLPKDNRGYFYIGTDKKDWNWTILNNIIDSEPTFLNGIAISNGVGFGSATRPSGIERYLVLQLNKPSNKNGLVNGVWQKINITQSGIYRLSYYTAPRSQQAGFFNINHKILSAVITYKKGENPNTKGASETLINNIGTSFTLQNVGWRKLYFDFTIKPEDLKNDIFVLILSGLYVKSGVSIDSSVYLSGLEIKKV